MSSVSQNATILASSTKKCLVLSKEMRGRKQAKDSLESDFPGSKDTHSG